MQELALMNGTTVMLRARRLVVLVVLALILSSVVDDQADAKRIYREMYILRHMRHNEIIHLRDVLMPAAYENFRDLYLVSTISSLSSFRSCFT